MTTKKDKELLAYLQSDAFKKLAREFEQKGENLYFQNSTGEFVYVSDNFCRLVRRKREALLGKTVEELGIASALPPLTTEMIKNLLFHPVWEAVEFHAKQFEIPQKALEFLTVDILAILDGKGRGLHMPRFLVAPAPTKILNGRRRDAGEAPFPRNQPGKVVGDISGTLNHDFLAHRPQLHG
ncbi:MAG: hypothetical protein GY814_00620 [Gammaproteobacteria bacterium]|nr:hypothetical protein [Gammaproteobacteria bacterium]